MLACAALTMWLSACSTPPKPGAGLDVSAAGSAPPNSRKAAIRQDIAPSCPTPTQWTPAQRASVADFIDKTAADPGQQLEAPELERLNDGAKICRTGKSP